MIHYIISEYHGHYRNSETFTNFKKDIKIFLKFFSISLLIFLLFVCYYNRDKVQTIIQFNKLNNRIKFEGTRSQLIPYLNDMFKDSENIVDIFLIENNSILFTLKNSSLSKNKELIENFSQSTNNIKYSYFWGLRPLNITENKKEQIDIVIPPQYKYVNYQIKSNKLFYKEINYNTSESKLIFILKEDLKWNKLLIWMIAGLFCFSALFFVIITIIFGEFLRQHKQEIMEKKGMYKEEILYFKE